MQPREAFVLPDEATDLRAYLMSVPLFQDAVANLRAQITYSEFECECEYINCNKQYQCADCDDLFCATNRHAPWAYSMKQEYICERCYARMHGYETEEEYGYKFGPMPKKIRGKRTKCARRRK